MSALSAASASSGGTAAGGGPNDIVGTTPAARRSSALGVLTTPGAGGGGGSGGAGGSSGGGGASAGGAATTTTTPARSKQQLRLQAWQQQFEGTTLPPLAFPPHQSVIDPSQHLAPLKDDSSAYAGVAKACLHLTSSLVQSSADVNEHETVASSQLWHESTYAELTSQTFQALVECLQCHKDRRARVCAATALALSARSAYARLRPSCLLYSTRENAQRVDRLQDEVGSEVPSALLTAALNDPDDGVSATAIRALGILTLTSSSTAASDPLPDALWCHVQALAFARPAPYAPSLASATDEDPSIPQRELTSRIVQNIVAPRLVQLLDRVLGYASPSHTATALPFLTQCWIHQLETTPSALFGMDSAAFAKRWIEVDAVGMVDTAVRTLLLPAVRHEGATCGSLSSAAAFSLIRLAAASPNRPWVGEACLWSALCLQQEIQATAADGGGATTNGGACTGQNLEQTLTTLAAFVVALRGVPMADRHGLLVWMAGVVSSALPSTSSAPFGIACAGVVVEMQGVKSYRRPARIALWTEMALSYFVDGPGGLPDELREASGTAQEAADQLAAAGQAGGPAPLRHELLHSLLTTGAVGRVISDAGAAAAAATTTTTSKGGRSGVLPLFDEILLAFASVAADSGRRFRVTADGTILLVDPEAREVLEWVRLAYTVLSAFVACINVAAGDLSSGFEDEHSLLSAAQASYMRLLQEYLYMVGLIYPDSSVAFKLTPNACPHLLWVQMSESALLLSRLEAVDLNEEESASKLVDELISREMKHGVSSQNLRMFLLTLATDSWIQGRMLNVRNQMDLPEGSPVDHANLKVQSAREILLGLSPKRLLAKMVESAVASGAYAELEGGSKQSKNKKDPVRKLAPDVLKACVACIEGIALTACDWRRRFGSSQESKHIVSVAVGLLQGKIDETPADDTMRSLMGQICEAAVGRIQAFYESESGGAADPTFPVSELVSQHVKPKIKPLIASLKPPNTSKDKIARSYLMQLCQQIVASRIELCVFSIPPADSLLASARPTNWLRLAVPPLPESMDARLLGSYGKALAAWGTMVHLSSAASDAVALVAAYTPRRYIRHDGEDEYRLSILLRAFNTTPIPLLEGLRLEVGLHRKTPDPKDTEDPTSLEVVESLGGNVGMLMSQEPLASATASFRQEIKAGDFVTWEVSLDQLSPVRNAVVMPSVVYRNVKVEAIESVAKWVGDKSNTAGDASAQSGGESKSGEDDFQVTASSADNTGGGGEDAALTDRLKVLPGEPLLLSPMVGLQPCPLVFFRDAWGDTTTFRLLWYQMPYHVAPLRIASANEDQTVSPVDERVSDMASLNWHGEAIPGGAATKLWAFSSLSGGRVLCVLAETESGKGGAIALALHFRGDDNALLYSLTGSKSSREAVVAAMCPGKSPMT